MAAKKTPPLSQSQILIKLGTPASQLPELQRELEGNGKLQQYYNQLAAIHNLPEPFNPSVVSTIVQDLIPIAAIVGVGAAAGEAGTEAATTEATATGAGAGSTASSVATKAVTAVTKKVVPAVTTAALITLLTSLNFWVRVGEAILGAVLLLLGLRAMTTGNTSIPVPG